MTHRNTAQKNTVAIIGAASKTGKVIARSIAPSFRLLLMDTAQSDLVELKAHLEEVKDREIDILECSKDASWEADIIVVVKEGEELKAVALKMKEVTTCKTVIHYTYDEKAVDHLQQLLPNAKVVTVLLNVPLAVTYQAHMKGFLHGKDDESLEVAKKIYSLSAAHLHKTETFNHIK